MEGSVLLYNNANAANQDPNIRIRRYSNFSEMSMSSSQLQVGSQQQQQQATLNRFQSPKKHKYYLYFKHLKQKYLDENPRLQPPSTNYNSPFHSKKPSNFEIDLHTLYSNKSQEDKENIEIENFDESNLIQDEEICKPNQQQLFSQNKYKEYLQANQSLPFRIKNVYNTNCDVKKNLNFEFQIPSTRENTKFLQYQELDYSYQNTDNPMMTQTNANNGPTTVSACTSNLNNGFANEKYLSGGKKKRAHSKNPSITNAFLPHSPTPSISSILFVNRKLVLLNNLVYSFDDLFTPKNYLTSSKSQSLRLSLLELGVALFNLDPLQGVSFLVLLEQVRATPLDVANYLHQEDNTRLQKKSKLALGRLLSEYNLKECKEIVHHFMEKF